MGIHQKLICKNMKLFIFLATIFLTQNSSGQDSVKFNKEDVFIYQKYTRAIDSKSEDIDVKLTKQTNKIIKKFQKQEAKIKKLLSSKDSLSSKDLFYDNEQYLEKLQNEFNGLFDDGINNVRNEYNAYLDTLNLSLKFLQTKGVQIANETGKISNKLNSITSRVNILDKRFAKADEIKKYLRDRTYMLKQHLDKYQLSNKITSIRKEIYYYDAYIKEYKEIFNHPEKIEQKIISLLHKIPIFQKFVQKNSMLASLFNLPGGGNDVNIAVNIEGLQTRASVQKLIQATVTTAGPNGLQAIQGQVQQAKNALDKIKDKIAKYGAEDVDIPDMKINEQKTKNFLRRIEIGTNMQFAQSSNFYPASADLGLSLGYKFNSQGSLGVGLSCKIGLGTGFNNIRLTSEGVGLRSYIDWKLKGKFYISGGYEKNYKNRFNSIQELKNYSAWQESGLIGVSRQITMGRKKGKIQLWYDFLCYSHLPVTQPLIYRISYNIK